MQDRLFRKSALERLSSPEQLDLLMQVTTPRGWLILLALVILTAAGVLWSLFGTIPKTAAGQGILIRGDGIQTIQIPEAGRVAQIAVREGDLIEPGQVVAIVRPEGAATLTEVISQSAGRVIEIKMNAGSLVDLGSVLLSFERSDQDLRAVVYVPLIESKTIRPGMTVYLSPVTVRKEEYGYMLGKVISVGDFPVTYQGMLRVLGSDELIREMPQGITVVEVSIELIKAPNGGGVNDTVNAGGFQWTTSNSPPNAIQGGTFCTATIIIKEQRPISLVFEN